MLITATLSLTLVCSQALPDWVTAPPLAPEFRTSAPAPVVVGPDTRACFGDPIEGVPVDHKVTVNERSVHDQPNSELDRQFMGLLKQWTGTKYLWGGNTREGADPGGFVQRVFEDVGVDLPSKSAGMVTSGTPVVAGDLHFGDLLVQKGSVRIYVGQGKAFGFVNSRLGTAPFDRSQPYWVRRVLPG
jgi:cell wall-associated NlpC family hydrolase